MKIKKTLTEDNDMTVQEETLKLVELWKKAKSRKDKSNLELRIANLNIGYFIRLTDQQYHCNPHKENIDWEDINQQIYLELPKILHSFKKEKGGNFLTYAGKCFKTKLYRYIGSNGNLIHIPEDLGKKIRKIRKDENMGLTRVKLEKRVQQGISALRINSLEEGFRLNGEESDSSFSYEQTLTYPIKDNLEKQANFSLLRDYLKQTFKEMYDSGILDENKYSVMLMRYVLDGKDYRVTLNEIGKQKQVSRQRVFQIEQAAIKIIKKYPGVMKELERYFSLLKKLD